MDSPCARLPIAPHDIILAYYLKTKGTLADVTPLDAGIEVHGVRVVRIDLDLTIKAALILPEGKRPGGGTA